MKVILFFLLSFSLQAATKPEACGLFDVFGEFKKNESTKYMEFLVNAGSVSEYKFQLTEEQERQAVPYAGHSVKMRAMISTSLPDYQGSFSKIEKIDFSAPDKSNLAGLNGFTLIKKEKCK